MPTTLVTPKPQTRQWQMLGTFDPSNTGIVQEDDDGFDARPADNILMDGNAPYNRDDNTIDPTFPDIMGCEDEAMPESDAMMSAPIAAGTSAEAASNFVHRIMGNENATALMEMYGQESLVAEANKQRRSLNVEGLRAFDLRTNNPDSSPWILNARADRRLAREMIHADEPEWVIGSPQCTNCCIWNRQIHYRKMPVEKVKQVIAEGMRHLNCCRSPYRRQLALGRHFLHEHPARALS